ncbi:MAG: GNAT family N-acetyltransferase [Clostridia bacterium]|nr:GNAT family N-acetyltransferase [Clostridia bacterium]
MELLVKTFDRLTTAELYEILKSRCEVFAVGQRIICVDEDDVDYKSLHCFFYENGRVTAYLRAYPDESREKTVKIGRVLVLERGKGVGTELMKKSMAAAKAFYGCERIHVDAQKQAEGFYKKLGFETVSGEYLEEGVVHVDMELEI